MRRTRNGVDVRAMRFIISAIFATVLLGAIASAAPRRGQQSSFRLERRQDHHHRKSSRKERRSLDDQWTAIVRSNTYGPVVEDAPVAPLVPDLNATGAKIVAETTELEPKIGDLVIFDENGVPIGVQHNPDQVVTAAEAGHEHHRDSHHHHKASHHYHHQQKHHKKVDHHKKASSHRHKKSSSKKHSKRAIARK
ncbi:hypothetical protein BGZ82_008891 [Podila clonocystis]|nr:hypothetical protein BGZ82_008891 [Podila clonocystis]